MRAITARSLVLAVSVLAGIAACGERSKPDILLIVIDTLRADHLGSYGSVRPTSPNLDGLASRGTRFANARSTSSWTLPSVASMLTGLYPAVHGAERSDSVVADSVATMAESFASAGYETVAFSANPAFVTPQQGLARGFERFDVLHGPVSEKRTPGAVPANASLSSWVREATAEDVTRAALQWYGARDARRPAFVYLHYFDPHAAYTPPPDDARRFGVDPASPLAGMAQWDFLLAPEAPSGEVLATLTSLYDAEIAATDRSIGHLLESMPADARRKTLIVVTSDHGEEFGEHGGIQHGRTLYEELIRVPLIFAGPHVPEGRVAVDAVSLAGLWATLADVARVPLPAGIEVEPSFEPSMRGSTSGSVFADLDARYSGDRRRHRRALIDGPLKLLLGPGRETELFDLSKDLAEQNASGDTEKAARMRARILERDAVAVAKRAMAPPHQLVIDPAKREQLKALGYAQ